MDSQTQPKLVYWSVYHKYIWRREPARYMISCNAEASFMQLIDEITRVTSKKGIKSLSFSINNLDNFIINDNKSMRLAIESKRKVAFDPQTGGISIRLNRYPNFMKLILSTLYTLFISMWLLSSIYLWSVSLIQENTHFIHVNTSDGLIAQKINLERLLNATTTNTKIL